MDALKNRLHLNGEKWLFLGAYKPPSISDESFETDCTLGLDRISEKYEHYILLGDLNFDMLDKSKSSNLNNVCDIFDLSNMVKEPTCFTSGNKSSLVDDILTCNSECIGKTLNFNCGLSDVHNIIAFQLKLDVPSKKPRWCNYRSSRNFDVVNFNMDLENNLSQINLFRR